ncbi:ATP-binding cassette domain-containing protein [Planomicrobium sp. YIM 101495]|uniref:ATP-binding cassette domain-containing protein n=1 Tax=Planomicrobium sp. YIM 101495 TaxID=2665160 RepID=UPI0012B700D0|nr:ABC transporter ATP-binding protein [Planomicrobium sp. YIM 101495]MTD29813.1 ATP-binding cassette domain-containing protein [Planomicrobium sp. YIM 101495]
MAERINFKDVSLRYGAQTVLEDLNLSLETGSIYALIGRNGAGKTSLLQLLASFREPSEGSIEIDGQRIFENAALTQQISFIYQVNHEYEYETVKKYIQGMVRYRPHFDAEYAAHLVKRFRLKLDQPVYKLSTGKQSALNAVIGLASFAPITILDEVYLGMDAPAREIFYEELLASQEKKPRTIILSTHLVSEMEYLFDKVVVIDEGHVLLSEDYESVISRGASITGHANHVDQFVSGMHILNEQRLGSTKSVMVYGKLSEREMEQAQIDGLEVGPVPLQDLFIHLTKESGDND